MTTAIHPVGTVRTFAPVGSAKPPTPAPASAGSADTRPGPRPTVEPPPSRRVPQPTRTTRVEVRLSAGVQTVTIYDLDSGRAIYQAPPEHTRQMLGKAIATRGRRGHAVADS